MSLPGGALFWAVGDRNKAVGPRSTGSALMPINRPVFTRIDREPVIVMIWGSGASTVATDWGQPPWKGYGQFVGGLGVV